MASSSIDWKPLVGMKFDSIETAYQFWLAYGAHVGFGVRKRYVNKSRKDGTISSCRFVCSKEGLRQPDKRDVFVSNHRAETRTDCKARIALVLKNGKFVIHEFVQDHNHPLQPPEETNLDIIQFFKHFEQVVEEKRGNELTCEYESKHKLARLRYETSPILIQMGKIYTHAVFDLFQNEFKLFLAMSILERSESHSLCKYSITMDNHEKSWKVSFNRASSSISCSCRKFETFGILCSHALKVFEANDVKVVPDEYILRRWTLEARCGVVQDLRGKEVEGDPKLSITQKFRNVVSKFIRVAASASPFEECLEIVDNTVDLLNKELMEFHLQARNNNANNPTFVTNDVTQPSGFKIRSGSKKQKRRKGWVEIMQNRKKNVQPRKQSQCQISQTISCSAPPTYEPPQTQDGQLSFTALLMAPFNDTNIAILD
ncbi:protein FAR1-RELATED SEQUENCE 12-like [Vicia villosa]|uniref:protein FAR1-RELATED SEQUENCE 12-like n=1 Tax=Vicia villosa TaxID=3911 RepID=UPI00273A7A24|nr:protein FAR1-RELATED SEQUENCE 12-like [Vicia villosa]